MEMCSEMNVNEWNVFTILFYLCNFSLLQTRSSKSFYVGELRLPRNLQQVNEKMFPKIVNLL